MILPKIGRKSAIKIAKQIKLNDVSAHGFADASRATMDVKVLSFSPLDLEGAWVSASRQLENSASKGIHVLSLSDAEYPQLLAKTSDPPAIIYVKGHLEAVSNLSVAVIGTRKPSEYGYKAARKIGAALANKGVSVVSGLAVGCDSAAHIGCVGANGVGVGVMAHGLDTVNPASNKKLAEKLLDLGGCLISEYPLGTRPNRATYVDRDRIQAGISSGVFVIETAVDGGTLHAVKFAEKQGRAIGCLSYRGVGSTVNSEGNQKLITQRRASPIENGEQLEEFVDGLGKSSSSDMSSVPISAQQSMNL